MAVQPLGQNEKIQAYAAWKPQGLLEKWEYTPKRLGDNDVEIRITHNGLCHSDVSMRDNEWNVTHYPLVPGHEIVGFITKIGKHVSNLRCGDRVGVGWLRDSCHDCDDCIKGNENLCDISLSETIVGKENYGGYAQYIRVNKSFAYKIPSNILSEDAAPLLCAGITVYTPLRKYLYGNNINNGKPGARVGIVGIGGLGHLAIRMAKAMGAHVTAMSTSINKKNECINQHGADEFVLWRKDELKKNIIKNTEGNMSHKFDLVLYCGSAEINWKLVMRLLKKNGVFCVLGAPNCDIKVSLLMMQDQSHTICSSNVGGSTYMREMLSFCATNGVKPMVQTMPLSKVNQGFDKILNNQARYRLVLYSDFDQRSKL